MRESGWWWRKLLVVGGCWRAQHGNARRNGDFPTASQPANSPPGAAFPSIPTCIPTVTVIHPSIYLALSWRFACRKQVSMGGRRLAGWLAGGSLEVSSPSILSNRQQQVDERVLGLSAPAPTTIWPTIGAKTPREPPRVSVLETKANQREASRELV